MRSTVFLLISIFPVVMSAQVWIDGRFGPVVTDFVQTEKSNQTGSVSSGLGVYATIGIRHRLAENLTAFYGPEFQTFRAGSTFEKGQGSAAYGHDLEFSVAYLSMRIGLEQQFWESEKFALAGTFTTVFGALVRNRAAGHTREFVSASLPGPDDEDFNVFIERINDVNNEAFDAINAYAFSANLGALLYYNTGERVRLSAETFYSFTFTPFLEPGTHSLSRSGFGIGTGLSYLLVRP